MAGKLEAIFSLLDQASGPASKIRGALKGVGDEGKGVGGKLGGIFDGLKSGAGAAVSALKSVGSVALDVAKGVGAIALAATLLGVHAAIGASETKRQALASLEIVEGTRAAAEATRDSMKAIANATGQDDGAVVDLYKSFRLAGQSADLAKKSVLAALDVKAVGSEESSSALTEVLKKASATGSFNVEGRQLKNLGIPESALLESLRSIDRYKNATDAQIEAAMSSGQIKAEEGSRVLLDSVNKIYDKGAGLGGAAKDILGGSVAGGWQTLKNVLSDMVENTDLSPITNALRTFGDVLKGPAGQAAVAALGRAFSFLGEGLAAIATPENITMLVDAFVELGRWISVVIDYGKQLIAYFQSKLADPMAQHAIEKLTAVFEKLWAFISAVPWGAIFDVLVTAIIAVVDIVATLVNGLLDAIGWCADNFVSLVGIILGPFALILDGLGGFGGDIIDFFAGLYDDLANIGGNLVDGLWDGIKSGWSWMIRQFEDLVQLLPDAVKKVLGIASPSKVMMELGTYTMQGFNEGVVNETDPSAVADAASKTAPIVASGNVAMPSGGSGGNVYHIDVHVNVAAGNTAADVHAAAEVVGDVARDALMNALGATEAA